VTLALALPAQEATNSAADQLQDAWPLVLGQTPHAPTFRLFDRSYGTEPITCDYVFVSQSLLPRVKSLSVNLSSRAFYHQPLLELV
jgi:hypothetical protein